MSNSYTSIDEFDLERRVWRTNEVPPYDMYSAVNSNMKSDLWKWILGSSKVLYDAPKYLVTEDGTKLQDPLIYDVYGKITNGRVSSTYGPKVSNKNPNPKYNKIEIDGVTLPEFDLLLHEVYRYLETLYPNHPDERVLLTELEFNDNILAAGDLINYQPDVKFFNKVAKTLSTTLSSDNINEEAAKLKIRNLLNNSFRRKLYGSKAGYRMFANDIFQLCTIFPVATYLPIKPVTCKELEIEANTIADKKALNNLNMTMESYRDHTRKDNRTINTYAPLYYRKFRLVDWDGHNSSFLQKADTSSHFFGFSCPCHEGLIFEYPNTEDSLSNIDGINLSSFIENKKDVKGITYVNGISNGIFEVNISKSEKNPVKVNYVPAVALSNNGTIWALHRITSDIEKEQVGNLDVIIGGDKAEDNSVITNNTRISMALKYSSKFGMGGLNIVKDEPIKVLYKGQTIANIVREESDLLIEEVDENFKVELDPDYKGAFINGTLKLKEIESLEGFKDVGENISISVPTKYIEWVGNESISASKEIHYIETSQVNVIPYSTFFLYKSIPDMLESLSDETISSIKDGWDLYYKFYAPQKDTSKNTLKYIFSSVVSQNKDDLAKISPSELKVAINPYIANTLLLEPSKTLEFYPEKVEYGINIPKNTDMEATITIAPDILVDDNNILGKLIGDVDQSKPTSGPNLPTTKYLYEINNFTKGYFYYTIDNPRPLSDVPHYSKDSRYLAVVETKNNKLVALEGRVIPSYSTEGSYYKVLTAKFEITAIPTLKDDRQMEVIYGSKFTELTQLLNETREEIKSRDPLIAQEDVYTDVITLSLDNPIKNEYIYNVTREIRDGLKYSREETLKNVLEEKLPIIPKGEKFLINFIDDNYRYAYYKPLLNLGDGNADSYISLQFSQPDITSAVETFANYIHTYRPERSEPSWEAEISKYLQEYTLIEEVSDEIADLRANRSACYETAVCITDRDDSIAQKVEYQVSTIRVGGRIQGIFEKTLLGLSGDMSYKLVPTLVEGTTTRFSLGNLNILPVIYRYMETDIPCTPATSGELTYTDADWDIKPDHGDYYRQIGDSLVHLIYPNTRAYSTSCHPKIELSKANILYLQDFTTENPEDIYVENYNAQSYSEIDFSSTPYGTSDILGYDDSKLDNDNITVTPIVKQPVKIEGVVDIHTEGMEDVITFVSEDAKDKYRFLSVGDEVFGPSLDTDDNNIYIKSIGFNCVRVNKKLLQSGTFIFTFNCKLQAIAEDVSEIMYDYKSTLGENGIYSKINPFEHGLYGSDTFPFASNAVLESLPDISFFKPYNYKYYNQKSSFSEVVRHIHYYDNVTLSSKKNIIPSTIKFMNDLFIELNLTKTLDTETKSGKKPALMSVDWLDYISKNLKDISRATDHANVGTNLMMETDSSGFFTQSKALSFTDPNVQLKFMVMNLEGQDPLWNNFDPQSEEDWTVPVYAQIGTGGSGRLKWFRSPADATYPNIWGNNIYDKITSEGVISTERPAKEAADGSLEYSDSELELFEKGGGRIRKRSTWGKLEELPVIKKELDDSFKSVENPLFEIPLGEYDVQTRFLAEGETSNLDNSYTTIQSSFYQETFKNLTRYLSKEDDDALSVIKDTLINKEPLNLCNKLSNIKFLGKIIPTKEFIKEKGYYDITKPEFTNPGDYYAISEDTILTDIGEKGDSIKLKHHSIVYQDIDNSLAIKEPICMGIMGETTSDESDSERVDTLPARVSDYTFAELIEFCITASFILPTKETVTRENLHRLFKFLLGYLDIPGSILWVVFTGDKANKFLELTLKDRVEKITKGDILGIIIPNNISAEETDISDLPILRFNRSYYTSTLPIEQFNDLNPVIYRCLTDLDSDLSSVKGLNEGVTEINLPRKCLTEGAYDFDYVINPELEGDGYLYIDSSKSTLDNYKGDEKEVELRDDSVFDIIDYNKPVSFNITKSAIYKDEKNNEFYTYTDKYITEDGTVVDCENNLTKVAIKFTDQKYFKNTTHISGIYQTLKSQESGSSEIINKPIFNSIIGIDEFNSSFLSSGDKLLSITPLSLRSQYSRNLDAVFFSSYFNVSGIIRGIDKKGNLVISYDNLNPDKSSIERSNFGITLKSLAPATKEYDTENDSYETIPLPGSIFEFNDTSKYPAPIIRTPKVTKPLFNNQDAHNNRFRYFKNLLVLRAQVSAKNPNTLYPANNDNGQFAIASHIINGGDKIIGGSTLTPLITENLVKIQVYPENPELRVAFSFSCWEPKSKKFVAVSKTGDVYFANDIDLDTTAGFKVKIGYVENLGGGEVTGISYDPETNTWMMTTKTADNIQGLLSLPFELNEGEIIPIIPFSDKPIVDNPGNWETVDITEDMLVSPGDSAEGEGVFIKAGDLAINKVSYTGDKEFTVSTGPYDKGDEAEIGDTNVLYSRDATSTDDFTIFSSGRGLFIKSKVPLRDKDSNVVGYSKNSYWKYVEVPLFKDKSIVEFRNAVSKGTDYAYTEATGIRSRFLQSFNFLAKGHIYVKKHPEGYYYQADSNGNILNKEVTNAWADFELGDQSYDWNRLRDGLRVLNNGSDPSIFLAYKYGQLYQRIYPITLFPWNPLQDKSSSSEACIRNLLTTADKSRNVGHYLYCTNSNSNNPVFTISKSGPSRSTTEYIYACVHDENNIEVYYYGVGYSYNHATTGGTSISDLYGVDLTFKKRTPFKVRAIDDTVWYADYLSMVCSNAYLSSSAEEVALSRVIKIDFSPEKVVLVLSSGNVITLSKSKTYDISDLNDINTWQLAGIPDSSYYSYMAQGYYYPITRTISFEDSMDDPTSFSVTTQIDLIRKPIYQIESTYIKNNTIILGGYILPRRDIESHFRSDLGSQEFANLGHQQDLARCVRMAAYYSKKTPMVLYSIDGGISFKFAAVPSNLPMFAWDSKQHLEAAQYNDKHEITNSGSCDTILSETLKESFPESFIVYSYYDGASGGLSVRNIREIEGELYYTLSRTDGYYPSYNYALYPIIQDGLHYENLGYKEIPTASSALDKTSKQDYVDTSANAVPGQNTNTPSYGAEDLPSGGGIVTREEEPSELSAAIGNNLNSMANKAEAKFDNFTIYTPDAASNYVERASNSALITAMDTNIMSASNTKIVLNAGLIGQMDEGGYVEVILSIKTKNAISLQKQMDCINKNYLFEYLRNDTFRVRSFLETSDPQEADRVYSSRETLTKAELKKNPFGYKALAEDVTHGFYEYTQGATQDGTMIYTPKLFLNSSKAPAVLCTSEGTFLKKVADSDPDIYTTMELLKADSTTDYEGLLTKWAKPRYLSLEVANKDPSLRQVDEEFTKNNSLNSIIRLSSNHSNVLPYEVFTNPEGLETIRPLDRIYFENGYNTLHRNSCPEGYTKGGSIDTITDTMLFNGQNIYFEYQGPELVFSDPQLTAKLTSKEEFLENNLFKVPESEEDKATTKKVLTDHLNSLFSPIRRSSVDLENRLEERSLTENGIKYYYDTALNYFPFKQDRFIDFDLRVPYTCSKEMTTYKHKKFTEVIEGASALDPNLKAITNIFLPQPGYGGTRLRKEGKTSWISDLPWEVDPAVFMQSYAKNIYGENITLADVTGSELIANNGERSVQNGEEILIVKEGIKPSSYRNVKLFNLDGEEDSKGCASLKVYVPNKAKAFIWSSQDTVNIDYNSTEVQKLANVKLVKPYKLSCENLDSSVKIFYKETGDFIEDVDGIFSIDPNGVLSVKESGYLSDLKSEIKLSYKINDKVTLNKIIKINPSTVPNILYKDLNDSGFYRLFENKNVVINSLVVYYYYSNDINESPIGKYAVYKDEVRTVTKTSLIEESTNNKLNLPVFFIGDAKVYSYYDYTNNSGYVRKCYIDDFEITDKCTLSEDGKKYIYNDGYTNDNISDDASIIDSKVKVFEIDIPKEDEHVENCSTYLEITQGNIVFTDNDLFGQDKKVTSCRCIIHTDKNDLVARGIRGPIFLRNPKFGGLMELVSSELRYVINSGKSFKIDTDITFTDITSNSVSFTRPLAEVGYPEDLDDGEKHLFRLRVLPIKSVPVNMSTMVGEFKDEHFEEIPGNLISKFTPDRVYFNPAGYPLPPVSIRNTIYRSENNENYTSYKFVNSNNEPIYECDENGHYIVYDTYKGNLIERVASTYNNINDLSNPLKPNYLTCKDWFEGEFYVRGEESNPFWQNINLRAEFNTLNQVWHQILSLTQPIKVGTTMKTIAVPEDQAYVTLHRASRAYWQNSTLIQEYNSDYLDKFNGTIRFIATNPTGSSFLSGTAPKNIIKYGIRVNNAFKDRKYPYNYPGYLKSSYTVNSTKNMANPADSDSSIVEITELGLFNKHHILVAYAIFPPIEYRTDSQHISFTSFIKRGSCLVDESQE